MHEITSRKHPDYLVDSCKRSSVNWMVAGSRLPRSSHKLFKHTLYKILLINLYIHKEVCKVFMLALENASR